MTILKRVLAEDETGAWVLYFNVDELWPYVKGPTPDGRNLTIEDFLNSIPHDLIQEKAHAALMELLISAISGE